MDDNVEIRHQKSFPHSNSGNVLSPHEHDPYQSMEEEMGGEGVGDVRFRTSHHQPQYQPHHPVIRHTLQPKPSSSGKGNVSMNKLESRLRDRAASVRAHVRNTQQKARSLSVPKALSLSSVPSRGMHVVLHCNILPSL